MSHTRVIVVGGGSAGFFGAITCAETYPRSRITLLEQDRQFLSKVRVSGGGRCNVTHACFDAALLAQNYPRGSQALRGAFNRFQPRDTIDWFAARGIQLKTEPDGRMFPASDSSETIVNCLIEAAKTCGVDMCTEAGVTSVRRRNDAADFTTGFTLRLKTGEQLNCDRVLLATGSDRRAYTWAESLGHTIEPPVPSLFTFAVSDPRLTDLAGISVDNVQLRLAGTRLEQTGPILITHWGLSGPVVLKLSAWGARILHDRNYQADLFINWLPGLKPDELNQHVLQLKSKHPRQLIGSHSPFHLPQRLWQRLLAAAEIADGQHWADLSKLQLKCLTEELARGKYYVQGKSIFKEEFVTCGGVNLGEVNFATMESRRCADLYFAGEILDIDGLTGGFNFQSAWTTGWIAGKAMGR
jgi:predicted Rossmann fold flavoprotein